MKNVLLISGKLQSGKNTFADIIKNILTERQISVRTDLFAGSLKEWCSEDFKSVADYLNNFTESIKSAVKIFENVDRYPEREAFVRKIDSMLNELQIQNENWYENKTKLTRLILQIYGTEIFRQRVDNDWWAKQLKKRVLESSSLFTLITDVRFPNEIEVFYDMPEDYKIITIRVERKLNTESDIAQHESETALDNYDCWNYIVDNNGSLEDLRYSAKVVLDDILENKEITKEYSND